MIDLSKKRYRLRIIIPVYPAFNVYSRSANKTTALGPVSVASSANKLEKWDVEVIDENIKEGLFSNIDYIVLGEGEETIRELLIAFEKKSDIGQIKGTELRTLDRNG